MRLLREEPPKATAKPEEPPAAGTKVFSLPARPPGETGELDPNTLPDWLKTGDTTIDSDDLPGERDDDLPDWLKASLIAKGADPDNLPRLEELTPEKRTTDDLPDWLVSASDTSPIIDSPKEISTEIYLDLVSRAQDAPDTDDPFDGDEANLPDWLAEAASFPDLTAAEEEEYNDIDEIDSPAQLNRSDDTGMAGESEEGPHSDLTDWLTDPDAFADDATVAAESEEGPHSGLTDWLTDPDAFAEAGADADAGLTNWLTEPDAFTDIDAGEDESTEAANLAGWLADLDEPGDVDNDVTAEEEQAAIDWFADSEPPDSDSLAEPPDIEPEEEAAEFQEGIGEVRTTGEPSLPEPEELSPAEDLDWLTEMAAFEENSPVRSPTSVEDNEVDEEQPQDALAGDLLLPGELLEAESEPASELEQPPASTTDDWLSMESFSEEDPLVQGELPEWFEQLGPPLSSQPSDSDEAEASDEGTPGEAPLPSEELPDWIASLRPNSSLLGSSLPSALSLTPPTSEPLADIPDELAGAELPEWLQDISIGASPPGPVGTASEEASGIPDWLITDGGLSDRRDTGDVPIDQSPTGQEWDNILDDLPPTLPLEQTLAKAEIPDWLQALKPREMSRQSSEDEEPAGSEQPVPTSGPLAGMRAVLPIEPIILKPRTTTTFSHLSAPPLPTAEQQQQVALLRQLTRTETEASTAVIAKTIGGVSPATMSLWLRLLLAAILIAAVFLGLVAPDLLAGGEEPPTVPSSASVAPVETAIVAAAGQPVLVAFEYTPALAGELTPQATLLLAQLEANGSAILTISQYPAGAALAAASSQSLLHQDLGYLPGDAIGLRQLGNCLTHQLTCEAIPGWSQRAQLRQPFSDVALIILLTGERNSLVNWIEQVATGSGVPIVAGITQALAPIAAPYLASGQLAGVLEGAPATALYQQTVAPDLAANSRQSPAALRLAQIVAAAFLLIGSLVYGISGATAKGPELSRPQASVKRPKA